MTQEQRKEKLEALISHIEAVQKNCQRLGFKLIELGEFELGKRLIANSYIHDQSKFHAMEWLHLTKVEEDDELFELAVQVHTANNMHHPEFWLSIEEMPNVHLCECICDWFARSNELGTDFFDWISKKATKKWNFTTRSKVYKKIMDYANLLVEKNL